MLKLRKTTPAEPLVVSMTGLRLGDRVLFIGCADPKSIAQLSLKPGLTGRACAVDEDAARTMRAAAAAEREGALLETATTPLSHLPFDADSFDVIVPLHIMTTLSPGSIPSCLSEAVRVLRSGGRCVVIEAGRRQGLAGLFAAGARMTPEQIETAMSQAGFRGVRTLAARDGLLFVEGAKRP